MVDMFAYTPPGGSKCPPQIKFLACIKDGCPAIWAYEGEDTFQVREAFVSFLESSQFAREKAEYLRTKEVH